MFPKSIKLTYKPEVSRDINKPLPTEVAVRGCNQIVSSVEKDGIIKHLKLRTAYDGLYDLELELSNVKDGRGTVEQATFKEAV